MKKAIYLKIDESQYQEIVTLAKANQRSVAGQVRLWIAHALAARGFNAKKEGSKTTTNSNE